VKRGKPLARSKPLRRGRLRRKPTRVKAGSDAQYLNAVRELPCAVEAIRQLGGETTYGECPLPSHAHHAGRRPGVGMKAADDTAIPLCYRHHQQWHDASGYFHGMTRSERRKWSDERIIETRAKVSIARSAA